MSKNWTSKQKLAIETHGKTLLVSAAAGSGKTATLTERIVRRLTDEQNPATISRMLIVTFTRLSAADLKRKISDAITKKLAEDPTNQHLSRQLVLLESAHICTIDSFYLDIVRSNFQRLGLPSNFRLADESEMALLSKEVMDTLIEKHYDNSCDDDGFLSFVESFTSAKQSDTLSDIFLSLQSRLCSRVEGSLSIRNFAQELQTDAEGDFFESRQGKIIRSYLLNGAKTYYEALSRCCDIIVTSPEASRAYLSVFVYEKEFFHKLAQVLESGTYEQAQTLIMSFNKSKLGSLKKEFQTEEVLLCKAIRDEEAKFIKSACEKYFAFNKEDLRQILLKTSETLMSLYAILDEFEHAALEEKIKKKVFEFDDIRRFAYNLLANADGSPSEIALSYREQFDEIYIDEYQDVDAMQDKIFSLIAKENNRFMVGDIKQSIYSFRGADTDVFAGYKKAFPAIESSENSKDALIFMSNNFRCDENIIKFTNEIFSYLFGHCGESIEYTEEDNLIFSKVEPDRTLSSPLVQIAVVTADESESDLPEEPEEKSEINAEALWIAREIHRLINSEMKADGTPIEPGDIAILMRSTTPAAEITKALEIYGIPCTDNSKYDLFETPDVLLTISLLSCIDNPHRDIPLAATLYSPIFAYTMDELIEIRSSSDSTMSLFEALQSYEGDNEVIKNKNYYFLDKLTSYRNKALSLPIDKLIGYIYNDLLMTSFESNGSQNLTRLYEMARRFEAGSFKGLGNFISYINELIENRKVPSMTNDEANTNSVQMITAHKSKGLEFPVCFICNTQSNFNSDDIKPNLLYNARSGIALKLPLESGMVRLNTPLREAVALSITEAQVEEEMRILYVALTRARERLYVTAHTRSKLEKLEEAARIASSFPSDFKIKKCKNWLSMILAAIYPLSDGDSYTFIALEKDTFGKLECMESADLTQNSSIATLTQEDVHTIKERLDFVYPHAHLSKLPAKLSVSKLTPTVLDDMDNDAAVLESFDEARILEIEEFFESKSKPTGADRGTATHLFLQFCDFENAEKNGVRNELNRLIEKQFIAPQVAELINIGQVEKFFNSNFYSMLKTAKKTYREQRFNILLPASHFTQNTEFKEEVNEEEILVQGVIDLFFETENGEIILCDYKTDYLTPDELNDERLAVKKMKDRHSTQLSYYAMAIERFIGKHPDKILIYSLPFGEALEIK